MRVVRRGNYKWLEGLNAIWSIVYLRLMLDMYRSIGHNTALFLKYRYFMPYLQHEWLPLHVKELDTAC